MGMKYTRIRTSKIVPEKKTCPTAYITTNYKSQSNQKIHVYMVTQTEGGTIRENPLSSRKMMLNLQCLSTAKLFIQVVKCSMNGILEAKRTVFLHLVLLIVI